MDSQVKYCQRCGAPFNDKKGFGKGTESDGSLNNKYCIKDYENGKFIYPDMTRQDLFIVTMDYVKKNNGLLMRFIMWIVYPIQLNGNSLEYWKSIESNSKVKRKVDSNYRKEVLKKFPNLD